MKISAVICGRNDNYGGDLNERAEIAINSMLRSVDEVVYVDWNGFDKPLTDVLNLENKHKLKTIVVPPEKCKELMGEDNYNTGQKVCDVLARNIGIRRATGDFIIDTNLDVIFPDKYLVDNLVSNMKRTELVTIARHDIPLDVAKNIKDTNLIPVIVGIPSISTKLMINTLELDPNVFKTIDKKMYFNYCSLISNCGDFQIAHRDVWYSIKGFDERMIKRTFIDTILQYNALLNGFNVRTTNFPPVYHIDHERNDDPSIRNKLLFEKSTNGTNWGFSTINF